MADPLLCRLADWDGGRKIDTIGKLTPLGARPRLRALATRVEWQVLLGCLMITIAVAGFAALAAEAREGDINAVDRVLLLAFRAPGDLSHEIGPRWLQESARDITALGGFTVTVLVSIFATAMLVLHRRRREALLFAAVVIGTEVASEAIKFLIARPRPVLVPHYDLVYSSSFPSGHAMMSPVVYLTLAAVLAAGTPSRQVRTVLLGSAAFLVVAIGVSRVYLGVHWPTDVLAGWALGCAIALAASYVLLFPELNRAPDAEARRPG